MGIFKRNRPNDVIFLMPVRLGNEKPAKARVRMLYCDAAGKVYAQLTSRSVYELVENSIQRLERNNKYYAVLGLEISPGNFAPVAVEIGSEEVIALEHILEHALSKGRVPDVLKKYLKRIIKLGEAHREAAIAEYKNLKKRATSVATPRVLNRLPYYPEHDMEVSIPIYKAKHSYPLIILKRLQPNEKTPHDFQRLLILDSDGDLGSIRVPALLIDASERKLKKQNKNKERNVCMVIRRNQDSYTIDYLQISKLQRNALDTVTRCFEETGYGKQPVSLAASIALSSVKDIVSSLPQQGS
ncbi:hypothetical protein ACFLU4_03505 [Chloroflexota bacterium]